MLIFHHRRYVLNLNNTDILPLRLFVPIIAEISNCQTKPIFILWNKCLLTCFLGDIFWQIWSRNLFTPCWPLIFYAPLSHHTVLGFICTLCSFLDHCVFFLRNSTLLSKNIFYSRVHFKIWFCYDLVLFTTEHKCKICRDPRKLHIGEHPNSVSLPLSVTPRTPTGDPLPPNDLVTQPPVPCLAMAWHGMPL